MKVMSGCRDCRNEAYAARKKSRFTLPKTAMEIASTLTECGVDKSHWGQKLRLKRCNEANTTPELLKEWESRVC